MKHIGSSLFFYTKIFAHFENVSPCPSSPNANYTLDRSACFNSVVPESIDHTSDRFS